MGSEINHKHLLARGDLIADEQVSSILGNLRKLRIPTRSLSESPD
jgi:hypothetical protein